MAPKGKKKDSDTASKNCVWTLEDDTTLLDQLKDEKNAGGQSDSGWKTTVWNAVATALAKNSRDNEPAKTWQKCRDHFQNKLKGDWSILQDLLKDGGTSGFGWDDASKCVTATKSVWDAKIKASHKYSRFRDKPYPYYDDMKYLVDGIVATGAGAFDPALSPPSSPVRPAGSDPVGPEPENIIDVDGNKSMSGDRDVEPPTATVEATHAVRSHKRKRAASDEPRHNSQKARREEGLSCVGGGLESIAQGLKGASHKIDHGIRAIELVEKDGDLADDEMNDIFVLFSQNSNWAKTYCTISTSSRRTNFARTLIMRN